MQKTLIHLLLFLTAWTCASAQGGDTILELRPDRVFDGTAMHEHWRVWVRGNQIIGAGLTFNAPAQVIVKPVPLAGTTLLPGLIEGHSHLLLHPYNETKWDEQVLNESVAERTARAVVHAGKTLMAGFTTVRDLGTEGAGYADVGIKAAIDKGVIPGPRMLIATRAIVATGTYGPKTGNTEHIITRGAAEADGHDALTREVRTQIGNGADIVKVYADYRWGINKTPEPTFSVEELKTVVATASASGRKTVAHASTREGIRRAVLAGITTIEHGDNASEAEFDLMLSHNTAYCATLAAAEATASYDGWKKGKDADTKRIAAKKKSFALALKKGVTICFGGDVGVYAHGDNAREMELMVEYGMHPEQVLKSATSVNAKVFGIDERVGVIRQGMLADIIAVRGNPSQNISDIRRTAFVMKDGVQYLYHTNP